MQGAFFCVDRILHERFGLSQSTDLVRRRSKGEQAVLRLEEVPTPQASSRSNSVRMTTVTPAFSSLNAAPVLSIVARITRHALRHMLAVPEGSALGMCGSRRQQPSVGGGSGAGDGVSFLCAIPNS
jgi:hypothetical protein